MAVRIFTKDSSGKVFKKQDRCGVNGSRGGSPNSGAKCRRRVWWYSPWASRSPREEESDLARDKGRGGAADSRPICYRMWTRKLSCEEAVAYCLALETRPDGSPFQGQLTGLCSTLFIILILQFCRVFAVDLGGLGRLWIVTVSYFNTGRKNRR